MGAFNLTLSYLLLLVFLILVSIYVYKTDPSTGPILSCAFNKTTGYKCPGCGMTRASHSIMHGDIKSAYNYNKLVLLIPIGLLIYIIFRLYEKNTDKLLWIYIIIIIVYGVLRNI